MIKKRLAAFLTGIMTVTLMAAGLTGCGSNNSEKAAPAAAEKAAPVVPNSPAK